MVEQHHQFKEFEQTRGDSEEQGKQHCLMLWLHIKFLIIITAAV